MLMHPLLALQQTNKQPKADFFQTIKTRWHRILNTTGLLMWESEKEDAVLFFCFFYGTGVLSQ